MHPTADTLPVIFSNLSGRRVMPGVGLLLDYVARTTVMIFRALLALGFVACAAGAAFACSCDDPPLETKFKDAGAVFVGEAVELTKVRVNFYEYSVRFKVEKSWKGAPGPEIEVFAAYDLPGMCNDLPLSPGEKYLVYADIDKDGCLYITRDCGPTANLRYAAEEAEQLQAKFPLGRPAALSADGIGAGVLYVLSFLAGCVWLAKRRYEGR
jgi:hypothetical protein